MIRRRLWAAWQVLRGRPFEIGVQWGEGTDRGAVAMRIPALTVPNDDERLLLSIGSGDWRWDGEPFPWATVGPFVLTFGDEELTTVTVAIAVRMAGGTPDELLEDVAVAG